MNKEIAALLILLIPFIGAALVPFINMVSKKIVPYFAVLTGLLSSVIAFMLVSSGAEGVEISIPWLPGFFSAGFILDPVSLAPALIATWIGFLVLVYSLGYMKDEENLSRYYSATLLFIGAMAGMSMADNFISLFFFWEVMGVCSYLLIGFFYLDAKAADAGFKAFLTTKIGDIGLLAAILLLYRFTGTFNIAENLQLSVNIAFPALSIIAFGFILGAVGKSAQVPLHVWLPDAMEAPTTISALIHAATMVNAGVYLLARVHPILVQVPAAAHTVMWIGVLTALLGSFLAVFNNDLKRILAYSTVSQLGYMIFAIGMGGIFASQFHLFSHAIFKALLFLCAGAVIHGIHTRDIREMGNLKKYMPLTAVCFSIGVLALMGIPVMNGFFSKDLILEVAVEEKMWLPLALAVTAAMLTVFYSVRTTWKVFFAKQTNEKHAHEAPFSMLLPLILLAAGTLFSWILIGRITLAWEHAGYNIHELSWSELLKETFGSHAFLYTMIALLAGIGLFSIRKPIGRALNTNAAGFMRLAGTGLGFDLVYGYLINAILKTGEAIRYFWDEKVMEGLNKITGQFTIWLSRMFCKLQTGDLHWNLVYILIALIIIIVTVVW